MIDALMNYTFIQNAFIAAILASIICGIIGTIIIEKKLVMMSGGIAHTSFGGIGLGYLLNIEPIIGALAFAVVAAFSISYINRRSKTNNDTLIGIFWAVGMALGILFIGVTPGYPPDMSSYLFGDILTVSSTYLILMGIVGGVVVLFITVLFNYWKAYMFDEQFAKILGLNVVFLEYLLFILIAITIVVVIKVVGIILVIALLTIPPAIIKMYVYDLKKIMIYSIILSIIICVMGLFISYEFNIASGATIILLFGSSYFLSFLYNTIKQKSIAK